MPELLPYEPGSPEWLTARRGGVTATDIVTIIGLSRYDSPYSLFWRKMGQVPDEPDRDRLALGRALEPYIAERMVNPVFAVLPGLTTSAGLYRHSDRAWQMATLDRLAVRGGDMLGVIELKSWADADKRAWETGPPPQVRAQVLWQMDVMDVSTGHVGVVFLPSGEFRSYTIEHRGRWLLCTSGCDDGLCAVCDDQILMREAGSEFMGRLRLELPPPDPDSSAATLAAVRARFAKVPAKQAEVDEYDFEDWCEAKDDEKHYGEKARELEIKLREQAGEASEYTVDGELVARRVVSDAQVKAHTRHVDYLKRVKNGDDSE